MPPADVPAEVNDLGLSFSALLDRLRTLVGERAAPHDDQISAVSCLHGTRERLLSIVQSWIYATDPLSPGIFWLGGQAGTGKTAVAYSIIQRAKASNSAHHFGAAVVFTRDVSESRRLDTVLPSIAFQLSHCHGLLDELIEGLSTIEHQEWGGYSMLEQTEKFIISPLKAILRRRPEQRARPVVIVVDGINESREAGGRSRVGLVQCLGKIAAALPFVRVLVTSYDTKLLREAFVAIGSQLVREVSLDSSDVRSSTEKDIRYFFQSRTQDRERAATRHRRSSASCRKSLRIREDSRVLRAHEGGGYQRSSSSASSNSSLAKASAHTSTNSISRSCVMHSKTTRSRTFTLRCCASFWKRSFSRESRWSPQTCPTSAATSVSNKSTSLSTSSRRFCANNSMKLFG